MPMALVTSALTVIHPRTGSFSLPDSSNPVPAPGIVYLNSSMSVTPEMGTASASSMRIECSFPDASTQMIAMSTLLMADAIELKLREIVVSWPLWRSL